MHVSNTYTERRDEIVALVRSAFSDSEGADEGALIGALAQNLMANTPQEDLFVFSALEDGRVIGAAIFTRLTYPDDPRTVFLLGPVAVATRHHGQGVGQGLLTSALDDLRARGVDVAITYGDIRFYAKVGFAQITEAIAKAPLPLQYPQGWLGQSLTGPGLAPLAGESVCVEAFNDPAYW
jgi:putative acetyltransferase